MLLVHQNGETVLICITIGFLVAESK
jgi:hypothetical protein